MSRLHSKGGHVKNDCVRRFVLVIAVIVGLALTGGCRKLKRFQSKSDDIADHTTTVRQTRREVPDDMPAPRRQVPVDRPAPRPEVHAGKPRASGAPIGVGANSHAGDMGSVLAGVLVIDDSAVRTVFQRVQVATGHAVHRRPAEVVSELGHIMASGEKLTPELQELLVRATEDVGTPQAAYHVQYALKRGLPLENPYGRLVISERGIVIQVRDAEELETFSSVLLPATDLSERAIYLDTRLRVGQEGMLPDLNGLAARWQQRPELHIAELRHDPKAPRSDQIVEFSTSTTFAYVPPRVVNRDDRMLPPVVIRHAIRHYTYEGDQETSESSDVR